MQHFQPHFAGAVAASASDPYHSAMTEQSAVGVHIQGLAREERGSGYDPQSLIGHIQGGGGAVEPATARLDVQCHGEHARPAFVAARRRLAI